MSNLALSLFVGPAVVVDDEVDKPNTDALAVVEELGEAHFPVHRRSEIPPYEEIPHWQGMSLIVLDWDLLGTIGAAPEDNDSVENDESTLLGLDVPHSVRKDPGKDTLRFVRKLMDELYCPIFIISNRNVMKIRQQLVDGLDEEEIKQLEARVLLRSKTEVRGALLAELSGWIKKHPAIYALKTWERSYERAKAVLFKDFQLSSIEWPGILWNTAGVDGVNPNYALAETISRNILHRMNPNIFLEDVILSSGDPTESLQSVRRVLHQYAVIPADRLYSDVTMPGDFFWDSGQEYPPSAIDICLTPACDLVSRGPDADKMRLFMVKASLVMDQELKTKEAILKLDRRDQSTSVLLHHLVPEDAVYRVRFKDWSVREWGEVKELRRGRLLDPFVTLLQQRNALFAQRHGLPRLPLGFHKPRGASK